MKRFFSSAPKNTEQLNNPLEQTLVIIKGDAIARGLVGEIIAQIEKLGLKLLAMKMIKFDEELFEKMYGEHKEEIFYDKLKTYLLHGFHFALIVQGSNAVQKTLALKGRRATKDKTRTLRAQYAMDSTISSIHSSDNYVDAEREIKLCFSPEEIPAALLEKTFYENLVEKMPLPDTDKKKQFH